MTPWFSNHSSQICLFHSFNLTPSFFHRPWNFCPLRSCSKNLSLFFCGAVCWVALKQQQVFCLPELLKWSQDDGNPYALYYASVHCNHQLTIGVSNKIIVLPQFWLEILMFVLNCSWRQEIFSKCDWTRSCIILTLSKSFFFCKVLRQNCSRA